MAKYLDSNGLTHLIGKIKTALAGKSDTGHTHSDLVKNVSYDTTSHKLQQTKGSTPSDIVTLSKVATSNSYTDLDSKPTIPSAGTGSNYPAMDGERSLGSNSGYARVDHVHPTDTSRAAASHTHAAGDIDSGTMDMNRLPVGTSASTVAKGNHTHGNITNGGDITAAAPTVASGDKLIINDESASKITNGPSFGTSTSTFLRNDGTWATPAGTTYSDFTGATSSAAGAHGLVPAPVSGDQNKILVGSGSWKNISKTIYDSKAYGGYGLVSISEGPAGHDPDIVIFDASYLVDFLGNTAVNRATADASGNNIASTYATKAELAGSATFQGTLVQTDSGSSATKWTQAELEAASYKKGWYFVVEEAGTYAGNVMEVGDMLFCVSNKSSAYAAADFTAIQNNIETIITSEIDTIWAAA